MDQKGNPKAGSVPVPPPAARAAMPSRLAGGVRKGHEITQTSHSKETESRPTLPQFGADLARSTSHRHQATVAYEAAATEVAPPPPGVGLDEMIARGALPSEEAIAKLRRIAKALEERHSQGLGHGGLTPTHVRLVPDERGEVVLLDAQAVSVAEIYEARYEAPELSGGVKTKTVQPIRSDVYALGAMFYEMVVGEPPFQAATPADLRRKHALAAVPSARQANGDTDLSPAVELVLQKALKKRPGDRPIDASAFVAELIAANTEDDRGTVHLSVETAGFLKDILEAKTQSEKTKHQVEEERRKAELERRKAEEETRRAEGETAAAEAERRKAEKAGAAAELARISAEKRKRTLRTSIIAAISVVLIAGAAAAWFLTRDPEVITKTNTVTNTVTKTVTETVTKVVEREVPVYLEAGPTDSPDAGAEDDRPKRRPVVRPRPRLDETAPQEAPKPKPSDGPAVF